jgi:hypothetical protein
MGDATRRVAVNEIDERRTDLTNTNLTVQVQLAVCLELLEPRQSRGANAASVGVSTEKRRCATGRGVYRVRAMRPGPLPQISSLEKNTVPPLMIFDNFDLSGLWAPSRNGKPKLGPLPKSKPAYAPGYGRWIEVKPCAGGWEAVDQVGHVLFGDLGCEVELHEAVRNSRHSQAFLLQRGIRCRKFRGGG